MREWLGMSELAAPASSQARRPQIPALTSLRFFAALAIVVQHATNYGLLPAAWAERLDFSRAVSFFFVLSGFVLAYVYTGRPICICRFYQARWARIWPSAALSILMVPLLLPPALYLPQPGSGWQPGLVLVLALLGLQALVPVPAVFFGFNAVTWCISAEMVFYALFPWLLAEAQRQPRRLLLLTLALGLALAALAVWLAWPGFSSQRLAQPVWEGLVYVNPLARLAEFVLGILMGCWFVGPSNQARLSRLRALIACRVSWGPAAVEVLVISVGVSLLLARFGQAADPAVPPLQLLVLQWFSGLAFAALIPLVSLGWGPFCRGLGWSPLVLLGEWSYGLFLYHQIVMVRWVQGAPLAIGPVQLPWPQPTFAAVLALSLVLAAVNWRLVERPCIALFRPPGAAGAAF